MKKVASVFVLLMAILLFSIIAGTLPADAQEGWFIGTTATPKPVTLFETIPQNPAMAPNGINNMHDNSWMTDTVEVSGPLGDWPLVTSDPEEFRLVVMSTFDQWGRIVCVESGSEAIPVLQLRDPDTLAILASYELPARPYPWQKDLIHLYKDPSGGVYFYLDNNYNVVVTTNDYKLMIIAPPSLGNEALGFQVQRQYDLSDYVLDFNNDVPPVRDKLAPALPDWSGDYYWYSTRYGLVGVVNRETGAVDTVVLSGEQIQNSPAVADDGFYLVSDHAMYRFHVNLVDGSIVQDWRTEYDRGIRLKPGMITQGCGPTPTIFGDLVAIADNAEPMNVLFLRRVDGVQVASFPVFDDAKYYLGNGLYASATENTLIGVHQQSGTYSVIVENNYGYLDWGDAFQRTTIGGVTRIDAVPDGGGGYTCHEVWTSDEKSLTPVPKMSLANGLVYLYTHPQQHQSDFWYFTAVDFETGDTTYSLRMGGGPGWNNNWSAIALGPDGGTAYIGTLGGLRMVRDGYGDEVKAATGIGQITVQSSTNPVVGLTAISEASLSCTDDGKPSLPFPFGLLEFDITGLTPGAYETVQVTIRLPYNIKVGSQYWKCHPTRGNWVQIPMSSDNGDNIIVITLQDGGLGDDDGVSDGTIRDQGGPTGYINNDLSPRLPVFPNVFIGIAAALGAGVLAYILRKRAKGQNTTEL